MSPALLALLCLAPAQGPKIDTTIPEDLRAVVKKASEVELDPKRGPDNAAALLRQEMKRWDDPRHQLALKLRMAATNLRKTLLTTEGDTPEPIRYEQALSTFSRLELSEPGLKAWIDKTLAHHDYAKKRIGKPHQRVIKATILTRSGLDKLRVYEPLADLVKKAGFRLKLVPAKQATLVIKAGVKDVPTQKGFQMVRVEYGIESIRDGKVVWTKSMFREQGGKTVAEATDAGIDWLSKVLGRDMFFRWLGETAFHTLLQDMPFAAKHAPGDGHGH